MGKRHLCFCGHGKTDHLTGHVKKDDGTTTSGQHSGPCQWPDCDCGNFDFKEFQQVNVGTRIYPGPLIERVPKTRHGKKLTPISLSMANLDQKGRPNEIDIALYTCPTCKFFSQLIV